MEPCYEYWNCRQADCVMHERKDSMNCWDEEETLCNHPGFELLKTTEKYKCEYCIYYKTIAKNKTSM